MNLRLIFTASAIIFGILGIGNPAIPAKPASETDRLRLITRIEAYLNGVRSIEAGFLQVSSGGKIAEGKLYLQRPKQLRLDYRPPATIQIYANGYWLAFIDTELEEISQVPLSSTPAGFLVQEQIALSGDVTLTDIKQRDGQVLVHLVQTKEPESGKLVLSFSDRPLRLQGWIVTDAQGIQTRISLINAKFNQRIKDKIFQFDEEQFEDIND